MTRLYGKAFVQGGVAHRVGRAEHMTLREWYVLMDAYGARYFHAQRLPGGVQYVSAWGAIPDHDELDEELMSVAGWL